MNKSIIGQVTALLILAIPAIILGWLMQALNSHGNSGTMTTIAGWVFGAIFIVGVLYFTSSLIWRHREKSGVVAGAVQGFFTAEDRHGKTRVQKWDDRGPEGKRWFLYTVLAVIAIFVSWISGPASAGIVVLLGLHLVIWPFFTEKTSLMTKVFISGFLLFYTAAFALPDGTLKMRDAVWKVAKKKWKDTGNEAEAWADRYEKGLPSPETKEEQVEASTRPVAANIVRVQRLAQVATVFELTPSFNERNKVRLPVGKTGIFYCSEKGAEMMVAYDTGVGQASVPSGQVFDCPTDKNDNSLLGVDLRNAVFYFRSQKPGITATFLWG